MLLTALARAFANWTGEDSLYLTLEGHGREDAVEGADLSRTVGWFTTDYPMRLTTATPFEPGAALRSTKEQLRAIPNSGFAYGVGRYLSPRSDALRALPVPTVGFNYLGQFDQVFGGDSRFRYTSASSGPAMYPDGRRAFEVEVYGLVSGGRLELDFEYSENLHDRSTIQALADDFLSTLRALIQHCLSPDSGGFTASDFSDFDWDASDLEGIAGAIEKSQNDAANKTDEEPR